MAAEANFGELAEEGWNSGSPSNPTHFSSCVLTTLGRAPPAMRYPFFCSLSPARSLIPFAIVLGHFPPEIARSNVGRRCRNRLPKILLRDPSSAAGERRGRPRPRPGNTQWKEYYGCRQSWRNATLKGVKGRMKTGGGVPLNPTVQMGKRGE